LVRGAPQGVVVDRRLSGEGSECTTLSNALAVTPLAAAAAMRPLATRPLTPEQLAMQAFFGRYVTPAQAAAQAMRHRHLAGSG